MRRLYLQIYLAFLAAALAFALLAVVAWTVTAPYTHERRMYEGVAVVAQDLLPAADAPQRSLQTAVDRLGELLLSDITVRGPDGALLAAAGEPLSMPASTSRREGWIRTETRGWTFALPLPDGRWLIARHASLHGGWEWIGGLILFAVAVAIGAYPVARWLTRRLERLREQVDELGAGDLSARVTVDGRDEVAALARSFNRAADQIEHLVESQRSMVASASHELRSPLARLRLAFELLNRDRRPELRSRVERDIQELDDLIDELLLASRLQTIEHLDKSESIDLLALVAEEGSRYDAEVTGVSVRIDGNSKMLRRMARNLFENARRYGGDSSIEASVNTAPPDRVRLRIMDRGPGVPESERERIFEPFYRPAGTREEGAGVGLGLALVRQIARHHNGDVRCMARAGGGTCFEVDLPRA
jgi:signal transduction histidine kinase